METALGRRLHYGWIIVATGVLVLFASIGLGRFSYTVVLPGMKAGLGLGYDQMGLVGTANFVGYLVAVCLFPWVAQRYSLRVVITCGLAAMGLSLLGMGHSQGFVTALLVYVPAGMGTAFAHIGMMMLIPRWFHSDQRGKASGLVICGNGLGIIFVGFLVPFLSGTDSVDGWRSAWTVFGLMSLVVMACAAALTRNFPADMHLEPLGRSFSTPEAGRQPLRPPSNRRGLIFRLGMLYLVFGATHMVYGTFIVTTMVSDFGFDDRTAGMYWSWVGLFSLLSGVCFGTLSDRIGRKFGLALVFVVHSVAYVLVGLKFGNAALMASVVLFGLSVFAIPAVMAAAVGDYFGTAGAAKAFSAISLFYSVGQTAGPAMAGVIAGKTGTFSIAYLIAALLTLLAAGGAAALPPRSKEGIG